MKTKFLTGVASSATLACVLVSGANAGVELFGHLGLGYNQGFGDYKVPETNKQIGFMGATGHFGIDVGSEDWGAGVGVWGGSQAFSLSGDYAKKYIYGDTYYDVSDLYFRYTGIFDLYLGRFSSSFMRSEWIDLQTQGVGLSVNIGEKHNIWATWANDYAGFGVLPNRIASEIFSFNRFPSTFENFDIGKRDLVGVGANLDFGIFRFDPFAHYYLGSVTRDNTLQLGARAALVFGNKDSAESTTSIRAMWQNNSTNTFLAWAEEELYFAKYFKLGGGWYMVGDNAGILTNGSQHTRFYGRYTTPSNAGYFARSASSYYGFAGVEHERVKFDVLYAGGDYKEFSAVVSVRVFQLKLDVMREGFGIDVGAGYVNNGFGTTPQAHNAIAFAKLVF